SYVSKITRYKERIHKLVNNNLAEARAKQRKIYNSKEKPIKGVRVGDLVMLKNFKQAVQKSKCFNAKFIGPFFVLAIVNEVSLKLSTLDRS
ncbi:hypothetical protein BpHYR1_053636, partial [Brachionus plicatilis]